MRSRVPLFTFLGFAQILLGDGVAIFGDGRDDGIEVLDLPAPDAEDLLVASVREGLEHGGAVELA